MINGLKIKKGANEWEMLRLINAGALGKMDACNFGATNNNEKVAKIDK